MRTLTDEEFKTRVQLHEKEQMFLVSEIQITQKEYNIYREGKYRIQTLKDIANRTGCTGIMALQAMRRCRLMDEFPKG